MKRVLIVCPHYLPGFRAGGPIRSVANMTERLSDEFEFWILTGDRDFQSKAAYLDIRYGEWQTVDRARVRYLAPAEWGLKSLAAAILESRPDLVHLQSFFHPLATLRPLWLRRWRRIDDVPFLLAPRGEFSPGALRIRTFKKRAFIAVALRFGLLSGIGWSASSQEEKNDILTALGHRVDPKKIWVAGELPSKLVDQPPPRPPKAAGELDAVFVSRISRKKNLDIALRILASVRGNVRFRVIGPHEDADYLAECRAIAQALPENVSATFEGDISHEEVAKVFSQSQLFMFPTAGENYGHAILEALSAGCPVLTSDRTPWRGLESKLAGWDLSLDSEQRFVEVVQNVIQWDDAEFRRWSEGARAAALAYIDDPAVEAAKRTMLREAMGSDR